MLTNNENKTSSKALILLLGMIFIYHGLTLLIKTTNRWDKSIKAESWPQVPADIEVLQLKSHDVDEDVAYYVETRYRYTFNFQQYESTNFAFSTGSGAYDAHYQYLKHVEGRLDPYCFVNPDNPSESILMRSTPYIIGIFLPLGFLLFSIGTTIILKIWKQNRDKMQNQGMNTKVIKFSNRTVKINLDFFTVTTATAVIMMSMNILVLFRSFGSKNTFIINIVVLLLSYLAGLRLTFRGTSR